MRVTVYTVDEALLIHHDQIGRNRPARSQRPDKRPFVVKHLHAMEGITSVYLVSLRAMEAVNVIECTLAGIVIPFAKLKEKYSIAAVNMDAHFVVLDCQNPAHVVDGNAGEKWREFRIRHDHIHHTDTLTLHVVDSHSTNVSLVFQRNIDDTPFLPRCTSVVM